MRHWAPGYWFMLTLVFLVMTGCNHAPVGPLVQADPPRTAPPLELDMPAPLAPRPIAQIEHVRTTRAPEAPPRFISLSECLALALENGRASDTSIRVLAYDPSLAEANIEFALSRFDAVWQSSMTWTTTDEPVGLASQAILTRQNSLKVQEATLTGRLLKPLATGGLAGITFQTDYQYSDQQSPVNPAYQPRLTFQFEQPLLQGAGVEINQLRASHPGSLLAPLIARGSGPGILLARVEFDRSRARLSSQVQDMLFAVEEAYWQLYLSYWELYSREIGMRQAHATWQIGRNQRSQGELTVQDLAQIEAQYQLFHLQRLDAMGNGVARPGVLEAERRLRQAMGLPGEDGTRLVPLDTPTTVPFLPCWTTAQNEALALRPDLEDYRQQLKAAQLRVVRARNYLLPDLRFISSYDINSIGSRLDGPGETNALRNLAENKFNNWMLGLRMEVPLGFREGSSLLRTAQLELARATAQLCDQQQKAVLQLQRSYRDLVQFHDRIPILRARRLALARQYQALFELYLAGEYGQVFVMLGAQKNWTDALLEEQAGIVQYNIALAEFERQKGTLLAFDNVTIAEGPLPECVATSASNHIRQRQSALRLRERALPPAPSATPPASKKGSLEIPPLADWLEHPAREEELPRIPGTR